MSMTRVGLSENKKYAAGYDAIFGKRKPPARQVKTKSPIVKKVEKKTAVRNNLTKKKGRG